MRAPLSIVHRVLPLLLRMLFGSLRITLTWRPETACLPEGSAIFSFWHGKMVAGWMLARKLFANRRVSAVVSLSEDGNILSGTLAVLGFSLIRGSSSKGSLNVREETAETLSGGDIVAITPDGPRGPRHEFKYGTVRLASQCRTPLLFADIRYQRAWQLKSWDRFEIPWPFSRASIILHHISVPEFRSEEELRDWSGKLTAMLGHD
ncbi:MAG: DUF374 domain-containing protein [Chlorobi bacterium]|nr:DUF374 domain-containing protein [Chlorobiota bacterium]